MWEETRRGRNCIARITDLRPDNDFASLSFFPLLHRLSISLYLSLSVSLCLDAADARRRLLYQSDQVARVLSEKFDAQLRM